MLLLAAGCASPDPRTADAHPQACEREYRVGSNIPVLNCATPKTEEARQRMITDIQNQMRPMAAPKGGGGG